MTADPLAVHAPGEADLNLYAYVSGALLKAVDPVGLDRVGNTVQYDALSGEAVAVNDVPLRGNNFADKYDADTGEWHYGTVYEPMQDPISGDPILAARNNTELQASLERTRAEVEGAFAAEAGKSMHNDTDPILTVSRVMGVSAGVGYSQEKGHIWSWSAENGMDYQGSYSVGSPEVELGGAGLEVIGFRVGVYTSADAFANSDISITAAADIPMTKHLTAEGAVSLKPDGSTAGITGGVSVGPSIFKGSLGVAAGSPDISYSQAPYSTEAASSAAAADAEFDFSNWSEP